MMTKWSPVLIACKSRFIISFETARDSQFRSYGLPGLSKCWCSISLVEAVF